MRRLLAALLLAAPSARAETVYVNAPLTTAPTASGGVVIGSKGGSFGADGWTTTGDEDAIWFLIPATLPTARVEVSVKGLSPAVLDGEEHDLIVTYGDTDREEPVEYMPSYRNNNFKTNLRIFGAQSPAAGGRPQGANKLELRLCPAGFPGHSDSCPPGCPDVFEVAYLDGKPESIPWDPSTVYRMKIAWAPGNITYTRGVEPPVRIEYPGTLAPKALRVRIGSPRHGAGSVNRMPKGITFKDVLIAGEPGSATSVCGGSVSPPPDAGSSACDAAKPISVGALEKSGDIHRVAYRHCGGATSFRIVQFWIGDAVDPVVPNLSGAYEGGRLHLGGDSCAPGENKTLTSAHGSLDCARTKVVVSGDTTTVDWAVRVDPKGLGLLPRPFFVDAKGGSATPEPRLGWTKIGSHGETPDAGVVVADDAATEATDAGPRAPSALDQDDLGGGELSCATHRNATRPPALAALALLLFLRRGARNRLARPCPSTSSSSPPSPPTAPASSRI